MSELPLRVLVVEDDYRIAQMHGKFIESISDFSLIGIAHNFEEALFQIQENKPELLLLDVYLPDRTGIELMRVLLSRMIPCDTILITASKESEIVEEGFRLGVFDYLIKPFDLDHLHNTLFKYAQYKKRLSSTTEVDQEALNDLMKLRSPKAMTAVQLQKGIDERTLDLIKKTMELSVDLQTTEDISKLAGVSLSTVRNYLKYMVKDGLAEEFLQYGTIGRPQRLYRMKKN
jgi:response regulator of citrate/malate metabolism